MTSSDDFFSASVRLGGPRRREQAVGKACCFLLRPRYAGALSTHTLTTWLLLILANEWPQLRISAARVVGDSFFSLLLAYLDRAVEGRERL